MEGSKTTTINVAEFLSVAIHLAEEGGKIIREVQVSGDLSTQQKDKNEGPVTIADLRVQKTIEDNLKSIYPGLDVQGEEEKHNIDKYEAAIKPELVDRQLIKQEFLNSFQEKRNGHLISLSKTYNYDFTTPFETIDVSQATVWVDPLDGTSDFVAGNLPAVTVLIGLSINGEPRIGVVHNPFSDKDQSKGCTYFGTVEHGAFTVEYDPTDSQENHNKREPSYMEPFSHTEEPAEDHKVSVACSISHFSKEMKEIIETIAPVDINRIGGAGNKCCNLARGNVDAYLHPSVGLKYWDLCAPETLIRAMGGYSTNINEEKLTYHTDGDKKLKGLLLAKNPQLHSLIVKRLGQVLTTLKTKFI